MGLHVGPAAKASNEMARKLLTLTQARGGGKYKLQGRIPNPGACGRVVKFSERSSRVLTVFGRQGPGFEPARVHIKTNLTA